MAAILDLVRGVIVASSPERDDVWWHSVDPNRVRAFITVVGR